MPPTTQFDIYLYLSLAPYVTFVVITSGTCAKIVDAVPYIWLKTMFIVAAAYATHRVIHDGCDKYKQIVSDACKNKIWLNSATLYNQDAINDAYFKNPAAEAISCTSNDIKYIPDRLPEKIKALDISSNIPVSKLPDVLPNTLETLICKTPTLTSLPKTLPESLMNLYIFDAQITELPDHLPSNLMELKVANTKITHLPDLPWSITVLYVHQNPDLLKNYPRLRDNVGGEFSELELSFAREIHRPHIEGMYWVSRSVSAKIYYINETNARMRTQARMRQINQDNILLELYMQRMMHPNRLAQLKTDPDLDVDDFMTRYVDSL